MKAFRKGALLLALTMSVLLLSCATAFAEGGDPTGASYVATTGAETLDSVATVANKAMYGANFTWVMICAFLVFFFQCGFAMVETGFCRGKNAAHTIAMNFMVFLVGAVGYFIAGFAIQMGGSGGAAGLGTGGGVLNGLVSIPGLGGIMGTKGFMLSGTYDAGVYALFFFQMVFMDTTVTIPTGAMAERVKYSAVVITSFFISMVLYPLFANWVWGGGWMATLGAKFGIGHGVVDFAGSAVVHSMGGMLALAGAIVIGPRIGKFKKDGTARAFPGHNIPMAIIGTIILFFCWFAFNAGSTLNASDFRLSVVATNTMIAGAIGGLVAMFYMWIKYGKPDPSMTANGTLAGLVANVRAALNRAVGQDEDGRKLLVDRINAIARSGSLRLTAGNSKGISKDMLDKWVAPGDRDHTPSLLAVVVVCKATGDAGPLRVILRTMGLDVMTDEDRKLRDYGRACLQEKKARKHKKMLEDEI